MSDIDWNEDALEGSEEHEEQEPAEQNLCLVSLLETVADKAKPASPIDFGHSRFDITRATEVIESLHHTFLGKLFPEKRDDALAKTCDDLQKDMKAFTEKVKNGPHNEALCKQGADVFLRMARLMQDSKVQTQGRAGGTGPADYNFSRALELAIASNDVATRVNVSKEYAAFLRRNLTDSGSRAKAATLEDYVKRNSK